MVFVRIFPESATVNTRQVNDPQSAWAFLVFDIIPAGFSLILRNVFDFFLALKPLLYYYIYKLLVFILLRVFSFCLILC